MGNTFNRFEFATLINLG